MVTDVAAVPREADRPGAPPGLPLEQHTQRLRAAVLALRAPEVAQRAPAPRSSVYGRAAAAVPDDAHEPAPRAVLEARFRGVETGAFQPGTELVLVVLPDPGPLPGPLRRSTTLMASAGATVVALGPHLVRDVSADRSRPLCVPLRRDDPLAGEWGIVVCGARRRSAFLARADPTGGLWSWVLTRETVAVQRAATALLERVPFLHLRVPALLP